MNPVSDLWSVLKGDGIALDKAEEAALGGPLGLTISLWAAIESRHGSTIAHLMCLALWLVQFRHCRDQLIGMPMQTSNYVRAVVLLVLFAPFAFTFGAIRRIVLHLGV